MITKILGFLFGVLLWWGFFSLAIVGESSQLAQCRADHAGLTEIDADAATCAQAWLSSVGLGNASR